MALSVILLAFSVSELSIRWYGSFIFVGMFSVSFAQCFSTSIARFSMAVLHPVVRSLAGIFCLYVLWNVLFFPACALRLTMKDVHSFDNSSFLTHFFGAAPTSVSHSSVRLFVHPSVEHHISGTVHHMIFIYDTHV